MKRNFFKYLFCTLAAILTLASLTGCKDDKDDCDNPLQGTVWIYNTSGNVYYSDVECFYMLMYFTKNKVAIFPLDKNKKIIERLSYEDYKLVKGKLYIGNSVAIKWTDEYVYYDHDYYRVYPPFAYFLP